MKKLITLFVLLFALSVNANAQTNRQAFEIAVNAISKYNGAEEILKESGLRLFRETDEDRSYKPPYYLPSYYKLIRRAIYVDKRDRFWSYMSVGVPESSDGVWQISIQFEFSSSDELVGDIIRMGFREIGWDSDEVTIKYRKLLRRHYSEEQDDYVNEYIVARLLVMNQGGKYLGIITFTI